MPVFLELFGEIVILLSKHPKNTISNISDFVYTIYTCCFHAKYLLHYSIQQLLYCINKNLLVYYCKCCNLIGYAIRYLFVNTSLFLLKQLEYSLSISMKRQLTRASPLLTINSQKFRAHNLIVKWKWNKQYMHGNVLYPY